MPKSTSYNLFIILLLSISLVPLISALLEYEALETVKNFADHFLIPANIEEGRSVNSTLFAEDVTGTVDLSTNFDSRELSTEYLFGLFVRNDLDQSDPSPFGVPTSYKVTHLVVQNAYIASSIIFDFYYRALDKSFPIQVDSYILINDRKEIQQYDAIFRRWAWATDVIIPQLIPHMAKHVNLSNSNDTFTLQQYLGQKVCNASTTYCTGENQQYDSYDACMRHVESIPIGEWYRMGENNLVCRHLHTAMIPLRPNVHCRHIGPSGGDKRIDRDYFDIVTKPHFPAGFIAPMIVTPENEHEVSHLKAIGGQPLDPLIGDMSSWDPTLYPIAILGYFMAYYIFAQILSILYARYCRRSVIFTELSLEHQKNIVMYTLNIIFTTLALGLQLAASPAFRGEYTQRNLEAIRSAGVIISSLYIFELVYRIQMRSPLNAHHFLTVFAISWTVAVFEYTSSTSYMVSAIIWLFQATTEQPTFLGLLGYRLGWPSTFVSRLLKFAAIQAFVLKSASAIALMVWWGLKQNYNYRPIDTAWNVLLFLCAVGLMLTQIWGSYVTYMIALRIDRQDRTPHQDARSQSQLGIYDTDSGFRSPRSMSKRSLHDSMATGTFSMNEIPHFHSDAPPLPSFTMIDYARQKATSPTPSQKSDLTAGRVPLPSSPEPGHGEGVLSEGMASGKETHNSAGLASTRPSVDLTGPSMVIRAVLDNAAIGDREKAGSSEDLIEVKDESLGMAI